MAAVILPMAVGAVTAIPAAYARNWHHGGGGHHAGKGHKTITPITIAITATTGTAATGIRWYGGAYAYGYGYGNCAWLRAVRR
jgi:hypothetical protein